MIKFFKTLVEISELLYQIVIELQDLNFNLTHYVDTDSDKEANEHDSKI